MRTVLAAVVVILTMSCLGPIAEAAQDQAACVAKCKASCDKNFPNQTACPGRCQNRYCGR
jgi:hypothetical protein